MLVPPIEIAGITFLAMGKDPAFLFYPGDFLTGTMFLTNDQVGIYVRLLCSQHQHGGIIDKDNFNSLVPENSIIRKKFIETEAGYYNERLAKEMILRGKKSTNISEAAKETWRKRKNTIVLQSYSNSNTVVIRTKDRNRDINDIINELKKLEFFAKIENEQFLLMCRNVSDGNGRLTDINDYKKEYFQLIANNVNLQGRTGRTEEWLVMNAKKWINDQSATMKEWDNYADYFKHFLNWVRKQPK